MPPSGGVHFLLQQILMGLGKPSPFHHMGVKGRILIVVGLIFSVASVISIGTLFALPRTVKQEIDRDLVSLADRMVQQTSTVDRIKLDLIEWPEESFETAGSYFVVLDRTGQPIKFSANFPANAQYLSRKLIPKDPDDPAAIEVNTTDHTVGGQTLRVLHYPIAGQFGDQLLVAGYLQIGRIGGDYVTYSRLIVVATFVGLAALCGSICALALAIPRFFRPLDTIIDTVSGFSSADDLSRRIDVSAISPKSHEFNKLSHSFNDLIVRMEGLFKTQQRLLADVSHELRTPLTSVQGNVDLMRRMGNPDIESLDAIESEANRMSRLVNDLLTLARADVGGLPIQNKRIAIDMIFLSVYEKVRNIDRAIRVVMTDSDQIEVIGDEDRLTQLLLNLMTNAVKYSNPGGTVMVRLEAIEGFAVITISDSGIGISAEDLPHIFDRFYRVNKARSRERGGSGLGLAIAQSIVTAHNGTIHVTSEVGVGSTFVVRIPASKIYRL